MNTTMDASVDASVVGGVATVEPVAEPAPPRPTPESSGSTDPYVFLRMRAKQRKRRTRIRRLKRAGWALVAAGLALGAWNVVRHRRVVPRLSPPPHAIVQKVSPPPPVAPVVAAPQPAVVEAPPAPVPSCEQDFASREWGAAIESCTRSFEAAESPEVALKIAHAHWSRGDAAGAGTWAARAVALGSTDADAYVLIGHSERQAGHKKAAVAAYRRYLRQAPHGWHAARVRTALRQLRPKAAVVSAAD